MVSTNHRGPLSAIELRVKVLESVLIEKALLEPAAL